MSATRYVWGSNWSPSLSRPGALGVGPRESPGVGFERQRRDHARDGERGDGEGLERNDAPRIDGGFEDDVVHHFLERAGGSVAMDAGGASLDEDSRGWIGSGRPGSQERRGEDELLDVEQATRGAARGAGVVLEEGDADVRRVRGGVGHANLVCGVRKEVGEGVDPGWAVDGRRFRAEGRAGEELDARRAATGARAAGGARVVEDEEKGDEAEEEAPPRRAHRARRARDPVWEGGTTRAACRPRQLSSSLTNNDET